MAVPFSTAEQPGVVGGWEPALTGVDGDRALEWAVRLSEALRWMPASSVDGSLAGGAAGLAVLFASLALTLGDARYDESAERYLTRATDPGSGGIGRSGLGLHRGLAGVSWAESFVGRLNGRSGSVSDDVDELLIEMLARSTPGRSLAHGLIGVGVYGLERSAENPRILALVLERLGQVRSHEWPPEAVVGQCADVGMAHGVTGLVAFATLAAGAGLRHDLLTDAMGGLLAQATWAVGPPTPPAWCHGDLGGAAALALAGPFLSHPLVPQYLTRILQGVSMEPAAAGVQDAGICHGAAGVAHVLHRVAVATGRSRAWEAARAWGADLLDRLDRGVRPAEVGLLHGTAGTVLVLLSLASDIAPAWDRILLLS